ncbi:MAG: NUDIX domain-containing protein [Verrucomicrobiia bacterium]
MHPDLAPLTPLQTYRHCPSCGSSRVEPRMPPQLLCLDCGFHLYFNPAVAAAALIIDQHERLLLLRREKEPRRGFWALPGGFVDIGERVEDGLRREIQEEIGLQFDTFDFLASFPNSYLFKGVTYPVLDLFFTTHVPTAQPDLNRDEASDHKWVPRTEINLDEIAFPSLQHAVTLWLHRPR